jgi:phenylalanyl-tRNA synthetase alpha chain
MQNKLDSLKKEFLASLETIKDEVVLKELESDFLGKKWKLKDILKWIKNLSIEEKKTIGVEANNLKDFLLNSLEQKAKEIEKKYFDGLEDSQDIDVSLEFPIKDEWHKHPISITTELLEEIFISLWFKIEDGPQIEDEDHNFDKLNIPANHPARDVWDTFWVSDDINSKKKLWEKLLLRTHTSPVQIRTMLNSELPIKIIVPGRVFRYEQEDARHTSNFYQLEWLVVWKWVNFWNLKWTLQTVMKKLLWEKTELRFRPSIFPFTEPSAEIDVSCKICSGSWKVNKYTCKMCSGTGWVELLWAWMVHPVVLEGAWIDPEIYSGFAFGMWIDRIAAQRFWVNSSRMFYGSKLKLNEQF